MSSQRLPDKSAGLFPEASSFRPYATETSYGQEAIELLLPVEVQRQLMEERRQRAMGRGQARSDKTAAAIKSYLSAAAAS